MTVICTTQEAAMRRNKQWDVRGAVGFSSLFYFLHSSASGCLLPFLTLYLRHLGLSAAMTGTVMAAKHLVALVWKPVSSILARQHNKRRVVITVSIICSAAIALMLLLFPPIGMSTKKESCNITRPNANRTVHEYDSVAQTPRTSPQKFSTPAVYSTALTQITSKESKGSEYETTVMGNISNVNAQKNSMPQVVKGDPDETHSKRSRQEILKTITTATPQGRIRSLRKRELEPDKEARYEFLGSLKIMDAQHQMFFLVMIVVSLWEIAAAPLVWTTDDGLYEYLDFVDATDRHVAVKPWMLLGGAGGTGCSGILVSILFCVVGAVLHFYVYAVLMLLLVPVALFLPLYRHKRVPGCGLKALQLVRGDLWALLYALSALLTGMAASAVSDFLLWQLQDLNATELQMGITLALAPLCQALFDPLKKSLTRLLKSHGRLQLLSVICISLQCLYYSFIWNPWAAAPAQILAALGTGALWWSIDAQCMDIALPGTERSVHRVFEALYLDLGAVLGSLAGGLVVQRFGVGVLFQSTAAMLTAWCLTLAILQWRIPRQRRINYSRLLTDNGSEMSESESEQENDWLEKAMEEDKGNNNWRKVEK